MQYVSEHLELYIYWQLHFYSCLVPLFQFIYMY